VEDLGRVRCRHSHDVQHASRICSCLTAPAWSDSAGNNADDDADADNCRYFDLLTLLPGDDADVDLFFMVLMLLNSQYLLHVSCV